MKKVFISSFILAASIAFLGSCKDDEGSGNKSSFTLGGKEYKLTKAFVALDEIEVEDEDVYYGWDIAMTSDGLFESEGNLDGKGDAVHVEFWAVNDDSEDLPVGTFVYPEAGGNFIESVGVYVGFDFDIGEAEEEYEDIKSATMTISKSGNTYTVSFSITLEDDSVVTGKYVGTVEYLVGD